jgi:rhamnosyltransferase
VDNLQQHNNIAVTVIMRSYNDASILPRTLGALDEQEGVDISLIVYESASQDNSRTILSERPNTHIIELEPGTYWSSCVLNAGVALAQNEVVVFVNSDAVILSPSTLHHLASTLLEDERRCGVFARQVPRHDANGLTRLDHYVAFENRAWLGNAADKLSLVCSAIRKSVWLEQPFDERLTFAEDYVWSIYTQNKGWHTTYCPEAICEHSHNYTWNQRYRRAFGDSAAMAVLPGHVSNNPFKGFLLPWVKRCLRDSIRLLKIKEPWLIFSLPFYRWPQMVGEWHGARAGQQHFQGPKAHNRQPLVPNKGA